MNDSNEPWYMRKPNFDDGDWICKCTSYNVHAKGESFCNLCLATQEKWKKQRWDLKKESSLYKFRKAFFDKILDGIFLIIFEPLFRACRHSFQPETNGCDEYKRQI